MRRFEARADRLLLRAALACLLGLFALPGLGAGVGHVIISVGTVEALADGGAVRALVRGDEVQIGDTLRTATDGRAQVRFNDGGLLSLRTDTEYRIDDFSLEPGQQRQVATLRRGALSTLTGGAAKQARERYRLNTPLAVIGVRGTYYEVALGTDGSTVMGVREGVIRATATRRGPPGRAPAGGYVDLGVDQPYRYALFAPDGSISLLDARPPLLDSAARLERARPGGRDGPGGARVAGARNGPADAGSQNGRNGPDAAGRADDQRGMAANVARDLRSIGPGSAGTPGGAVERLVGAASAGADAHGGAQIHASVAPLERGDVTLDTLFSRVAASAVFGLVANATAAPALRERVHGGVTIFDRTGNPAFTFAGDRAGIGGQQLQNTAVLYRGPADLAALQRDVAGVTDLTFGVFADGNGGPAVVQRGIDQVLVPQLGLDVLWVAGPAPRLADLTVNARFNIVAGQASGQIGGVSVQTNVIGGGFDATLDLGSGSITNGSLSVQFAAPVGVRFFDATLSGSVSKGAINFDVTGAQLRGAVGAGVPVLSAAGDVSGFFVGRGDGFAGAFNLSATPLDGAQGVFAATPGAP